MFVIVIRIFLSHRDYLRFHVPPSPAQKKNLNICQLMVCIFLFFTVRTADSTEGEGTDDGVGKRVKTSMYDVFKQRSSRLGGGHISNFAEPGPRRVRLGVGMGDRY